MNLAATRIEASVLPDGTVFPAPDAVIITRGPFEKTLQIEHLAEVWGVIYAHERQSDTETPQLSGQGASPHADLTFEVLWPIGHASPFVEEKRLFLAGEILRMFGEERVIFNSGREEVGAQ